jgi:hypothetical protein
MCILGRYEPACNTGGYEWDYKFDYGYPTLKKLNRYLVELDDLDDFIDKYENHYYIITPLPGWSKIQRKLHERKFEKDNWFKIDFCKIEEEKESEYKPIEDRVTSYYAKKLDNSFDFKLINENYSNWRNLYIIVSKKEYSVSEVNGIFSQIVYLKQSNAIFDYLILENIGFFNLRTSFFHEEYSRIGKAEGIEEKILIYYCPWKLKA